MENSLMGLQERKQNNSTEKIRRGLFREKKNNFIKKNIRLKILCNIFLSSSTLICFVFGGCKISTWHHIL
jgi:hypothetical protein